MAKPKLTIIVPTLDEGPIFDYFLSRLFTINDAKSAQIIVVDGGSSDNTRDIVIDWQKTNKNLEWAEAPAGKGIALRVGFGKAKANNIIFIDADLQYPPEEIPRVLRALSKSDLVVTRRRRAPFDHRRVLSLGFSQVVGKHMLGLAASDPQSGLKGVRMSLLKKLDLKSRGFELDAELIRKAQGLGARINEIDINFEPRAAGKTKTDVIGTSANLLSGSVKLLLEKNMPRAG